MTDREDGVGAGVREMFICYYHGCRKSVSRQCFARRCRRMVKLPASSLWYASGGLHSQTTYRGQTALADM